MRSARSIRSPGKIFAVLATALPPVILSGTAHAVLTISKNPTANVTCKNGTCTTTAGKAVLNATQLETLLKSSNVIVLPGKRAGGIEVLAPLSWATGSSLTLDAYQSIAIADPVAVDGAGGLTLTTNDGGTGGSLSFSGKGAVRFKSLTTPLTINGASFTLVGTVATLASAIGANSAGNYALAKPYNAKNDGTYSTAPIGSGFTGSLEGLGNTISNLAINDQTSGANVGLFAFIAAGGSVNNLGLTKVTVTAGSALVGALVGLNNGTIANVYSTGTVTAGNNANVGGLVGRTYQATISRSHSSAMITDTANADIGGLVGLNYDAAIVLSYATGAVVGGVNYASGGLVGVSLSDGNSPVSISQCYATGAVSGSTNDGVGGLVGANQSASGPAASITQSWASGTATSNASAAATGGLVGYNQNGAIQNSYAIGASTAASNEYVGGLVGYEDAASSIADSYSSGAVTGGSGTDIGGLLGYDNSGQANTDAYWDTTTSGISNLSQGAGNIANDAGITGRTTAQLQAGLPAGFATSIWTEKATINGGLPYLIALPPK
jgi:hypothetical protein